MQQLKDIKFDEETKKGQILKKSLWYISISRNALIVLITSCIGYTWTESHSPPFRLSGTISAKNTKTKFNCLTNNFMDPVGKVEPGMPEVSLPPFQIEYHNRTLSFTEVCTELGSGIIVVPLVAVLANVAIAKAFSELISFIYFPLGF